jgi:hypothetical protein
MLLVWQNTQEGVNRRHSIVLTMSDMGER